MGRPDRVHGPKELLRDYQSISWYAVKIASAGSIMVGHSCLEICDLGRSRQRSFLSATDRFAQGIDGLLQEL